MSDYDVIVIGSGAGGGSLVNRLAPPARRCCCSSSTRASSRAIGAVNPALTTMANTLRIGDHLLQRRGG
jgi:choline dehydrogenase-like flavoprotein